MKSGTLKRSSLPVRLPGFLGDDEIGLGDAVMRATNYIGMTPCGGCKRRAAALNRWFAFSGRRRT